MPPTTSDLNLPIAQPGDYAQFLADRKIPGAVAAPVAPKEPTADPDPAPKAAADAPVVDPFTDPETGQVIKEPTRNDRRLAKRWEENQQLRKELDALKASLATPDPEPEPAADPAKADQALTAAAQQRIRSKPDRAQIGTTYATYEDYVEDCAIWGGELAAEKREIKAEQVQAEASVKTVQTAFAQDCATAKAEHADFDTITQADIPINQAMWDATIHAPDGLKGHVLYWLGSHTEDCARIAKLAPGPALVAMGEVIATVRAERTTAKAEPKAEPKAVVAAPASPPKPQTKAPPPLPVIAQHAASVSSSADVAQNGGRVTDYMRMRDAEQYGRRVR